MILQDLTSFHNSWHDASGSRRKRQQRAAYNAFSTCTSAGIPPASTMLSMFSTTSHKFAQAQHAIRAVWTSGDRIALITGGSPPNLVMLILFSSEKLREHRHAKVSRWISGSSVRARYKTGSRPPSSVTCLRTSLFCPTFTRAYAAYCRT